MTRSHPAPRPRPARAPLTVATPPLVLQITCPNCAGTSQDPAVPAALAEDLGTCLVCCDPTRACYVRPGIIDAAPVWRTLELSAPGLPALRAAASLSGLTAMQTMEVRSRAMDGLVRRGFNISAVLDRLVRGHAQPFGLMTDRVARSVERLLAAH